MSTLDSISSAPETATRYTSAKQFIAAEDLPAGSVYVTHEVFTPSDPKHADQGYVSDRYYLLLEPGHDGQPSRVLALGSRNCSSRYEPYFNTALRLEEASRVLWEGITIRTLSPESHWIVVQEMLKDMKLEGYLFLKNLHEATGGTIKLLADMIAYFEAIHPRHQRLAAHIARICMS